LASAANRNEKSIKLDDVELGQRREMMNEWGQFIMQKASKIAFPFALRAF
jgi:hypothetical protein